MSSSVISANGESAPGSCTGQPRSAAQKPASARGAVLSTVTAHQVAASSPTTPFYRFRPPGVADGARRAEDRGDGKGGA